MSLRKIQVPYENQIKTETVAEFIAELRHLAMHCQFDAVLNDTLRDGHVVGLCSKTIQKKLLSQKILTFTKTFSMAKAMEGTAINSKLMHQESASVEGTPVYHFRRNSRLQPDASLKISMQPCPHASS